jgi:hypothetical protein
MLVKLTRDIGAEIMSSISEGFQEYFEDFDLTLPEPIPAKGKLQTGGWNIAFVLGKDDGGNPCLDFFAEHRMTTPSHVRILHDGSIESLASYQMSYSHDPDVEGDEDRAIQEMEAHNDRVSEILKAKGLI